MSGLATEQPDLWEVRRLDSGLVLELRAGDTPSLVLGRGDIRIKVELSHVKGLVAALTDAAAGLAQVLAADGVSG